MLKTAVLLSSLFPLVAIAGCDDDSGSGPAVDLSVPQDLAAPDLAPLPPPPGIKLIDISNPADLTPEGRFALLQDMESPLGDIYIYDVFLDKLDRRGSAANPDPAMGNLDLGSPIVPQGVFGLSADTSRIVGTHGSPQQAAFLDSDGWHHLGQLGGTAVCPGSSGNIDDQGSATVGWDISDDGKVIVGMAWDSCAAAKAIRWTDQGGGLGVFTALTSAGKAYNRATKVSSDGTIAGGWFDTASVDRSPAVWRADGSIIKLDPTGQVIGEVLAISADGQAVAGPWNDATGNNGFYFTQAGGVKLLPLLPNSQPSDQVFPNAIAAGGELIFGGAGDQTGLGNPMRAWVWTASNNKIQLLQDLVTLEGFTIPTNLVLATVQASSDDGSIVLGTTLDMDPSLPVPKQRSFVLRMPVSVYSRTD
jgi:hypothetical protein